ncbi:lantibiotic dehydratase family protein [Spongiimicrobium sp. 3-5]|uniref:lantibiotic dehydratase family protein n=1 Tax=Spongiimicrobium sp. 3-5 TaxID=3332596 RepID=UPI00398133D6
MNNDNRNPYKNFPNYILRTPLFSLDFYLRLSSKKDISDEDFKETCQNPIIREALFLASPPLSNEIIRWLNGEVEDKKKVEKLKFSILKYLSRMSSRCTPFGLFAGCSVGQFGETTHIVLSGPEKNKRHTRLDMNYLVALSQDLIINKKIREQLLFFPNTSIYRAGNQIRYIEYKYVNSKRHHHIIAVDASDYLEKVLKKATKGAKLEDLAKLLVDNEITIEEATDFIEDLVFSQLLISELEPSVSGPGFLEQISSVLVKLEGVEDILRSIEKVNQKLDNIDKCIGNDPNEYLQLSEFLKTMGTEFELKYLFQTDLLLSSKENTIDKEITNDLKKGLTLLNKISAQPQETTLSKFKDAFRERFEEREVALSTALDVEIGIGYKQDQGSGDINPLVDNIVLNQEQMKHPIWDVKWTSIDSLFQRKLMEAYSTNAYKITLTDKDFEDYEATWEDLPDTLSCMIEIVSENGEEKIKFTGGGGSSASNLMGRFCHGDQKLHQYTKEIIEVETQMNHDKILAEIVHLPESRVGNILMRPSFRKYEIPYLAKSIKPEKHRLPLDDLVISLRNRDGILLKSKKHNKEVVPHLTNAHNYAHNSLPIYHFLADMQTQGIRNGLGFNLGAFVTSSEFLPRVEYRNLILHEATWNLRKSHIEELLKLKDNNDTLMIEIQKLRKDFLIPQYVKLADGDNELLINFENLTSVRMFLDIVNKRSDFKLTEFLFSEKGIVRQGEEYYTNQVIVSFFNEKKLANSKSASNE